MGDHRTSRLLGLAMVAASALLLGSALFGLYRVDANRASELRQAQAADAWARYDTGLQSCYRGNTVRVLVNALVDRVDPQLAHAPIVSCETVVPAPRTPRPKEAA